MIFTWIKRLILSISLVVVFYACGGGGGGGGGDAVIGADVSIGTDPNKIDSGDRTVTKLEVNDVNTNGVVLKVRYPKALAYVADTSRLLVDGTSYVLDPDVLKTSGDSTYQVYFLAQGQFGDGSFGEISFQLRARDSVTDGKIEVDPDVDDPAVSRSRKFSVDDPQFDAEDFVYITVKDNSGSTPGGTTTGTVAATATGGSATSAPTATGASSATSASTATVAATSTGG